MGVSKLSAKVFFKVNYSFKLDLVHPPIVSFVSRMCCTLLSLAQSIAELIVTFRL